MRAVLMSPPVDATSFVEQHQDCVWTYLRLLGCDPASADDLTQETFLVVLRRPFEARGDRAARTFLRRTARNLYLASRRDAARRDEILRAEAAEAVWERRCPREEPEEYLQALRSCLEHLAERARTALGLRYEERRSGREIAAALGLSTGAVDALLHRTRERLRRCIEGKVVP
jgi:RNA polymerase sigma-70 factor (ECF subfamily)